MGAAVPLIAADRSVQCCSVTPGDCDVNCACVCFCLCVTALQLTRALTSFALKYCSSEQNHGHTNTKTQSRRWQFQCCSRLACVLLSIYECVYVCVCTYYKVCGSLCSCSDLSCCGLGAVCLCELSCLHASIAPLFIKLCAKRLDGSMCVSVCIFPSLCISVWVCVFRIDH